MVWGIGRLRRGAGVLVLALVVTAGCAGQPPVGALLDYRGEEGGLQFITEPLDAKVFVNAELKGTVADFQGPNVLWLPRGLYAVEIRRDGFHTFFRQIEISHGLLEVMVFRMRPNDEGARRR